MVLAVLQVRAERVAPETAQKVAFTFLNNNGAKAAQMTDLSETAGFNNLYIFTTENSFVVISADDCVQPILGYSLRGGFKAENMPENIRYWLQGYSDEIQYAVDHRLGAAPETKQAWEALVNGKAGAAETTVIVDALVQTQWDQDPGYNEFCPYDQNAGELTVTGCVATAMAQIMRYWEYPSHGLSSHSYTPSNHPEYGVQSVNYAQTTYDWTDMPLYSPTSEIAKLMYHCGVSVDMQYGIGSEGGSSAYSNDIPYALTTYFNYKSGVSHKFKSSYSDTSWLNLIKNELNAGRPVEYNGSGSGGGHAFVCDGYDNSNYFHFNWGWSGRNDGFYLLSNLNPGSGGSGGGSYNFTNNQNAVIGIQPKVCTASVPTQLNATIVARNATLTWDAASNAAAYHIYKNGLLVACTTDPTYTDADLSYGTYTYYVKSRDGNGSNSAASASIVVAIEPVPTGLTATKQDGGALLSWTEPEWCAPQTDDEVLTYGDGVLISAFGGSGNMNIYFGHKYPTSMLSANKVIYKVSFYATATGAFELHVYSATAGNSKPQTQIFTQNATVTGTGWNDIVLSNPLQIDATKDLWVFIYDPEGKAYPMGVGAYSGSNSNGNMISTSNPTSNVYPQNYVMLIRTCITDGSFFYNLYDNNSSVASNLSGTSYTLSSIANNTAHQYSLKTNFNGGETAASNVAGLAIGSASINGNLTLSGDDRMTVVENGVLTVSGTFTNDDASRLLIEEGGQLVASNDVEGTMSKGVVKYTGEKDSYYLIASPVAEENYLPTDLTSGTYDLYLFDQSASDGLEWRNYQAAPFYLQNGMGYLYANAANNTFEFVGTLNNTDGTVAVDYNDGVTFKGFNLIGNPFPCNAYLPAGMSYYRINGEVLAAVTDGSPIAPLEGVFVEVDEAGTIAFSKDEPVAAFNPINIEVTSDKGFVDRAALRFDEGGLLHKFQLNKNTTKLYIPQSGKDYAVVRSNGQGEMPVNFKASKNGSYTISVSTEMEMTYLHLIDNMTGADVDMLTESSYTFEAKTSDYPSRFRLVFASICEDADGSNEAFAYYDGSAWNVSNVGEATMQVIDMQGRIVSSETINGNVTMSTANLSAGVYVMRLVNGDNVKTQKMVVR